MSDNFIPMYDLESLTEEQRQEYLKAVCKHLGVPDNLNLVALARQDDGEGPSRLIAYAKRGATENVRNSLEINITSLTSQLIGGSIVFTATGTSKKTGRQEISTGSKYIEGATGKFLDDAIMTAQTRALRRLTLQFVGAGVLDESEIHPGKTVTVNAPVSQLVLSAPLPTSQPNNAPGKDVTMIGPSQDPKTQAQVAAVIAIREAEASTSQEDFSKRMEALRADAIAQLNASTKPSVPLAKANEPEQGTSGNGIDVTPALTEPAKKTRKPRGPNKPKVDFGASVQPVPAQASLMATPKAEPEPTKPPVAPVPEPVVVAAVVPPLAPSKSRLTPEQVKPFRQRMFRLINDSLEPAGFAPKEGMGNSDKMRAFANVMFPEVTNMNELTLEQWEKYLTALESKNKTEGSAATVKYIEDAIGI